MSKLFFIASLILLIPNVSAVTIANASVGAPEIGIASFCIVLSILTKQKK